MFPSNNIKNLRPHYECNDRFQREDERLKTFENWPLEWLDRKVLATIGMFYTGIDDKTKCYFCEVVVGRWNRNDNPQQEHLRLSPNCSLLNRRITNNIPINVETLERILPKPTRTTCRALKASNNNLIYVNEASSSSPSIVSSSNTAAMFDPAYASETIRWSSFAKWPRFMKPTAQQLAEAGDHVKCFSCCQGLKHWEPVLDKFKNTENKMDLLLEQSEKRQSEQAAQTKPLTVADEVEEKLCRICFTNEYNTVFLSCGHVVSCYKCAASITQCPICRQTINGVMRLYFT